MRAIAMLIPLLAIAACAPPIEREREIRAPAIRATGEIESCVDTARISDTDVHDDYTIDFEVGGKTYRNTLPNRCFSLGFEERFAYSTSTARLCQGELITVLHSDGGRGASCALGGFLPVELEQR